MQAGKLRLQRGSKTPHRIPAGAMQPRNEAMSHYLLLTFTPEVSAWPGGGAASVAVKRQSRLTGRVACTPGHVQA